MTAHAESRRQTEGFDGLLSMMLAPEQYERAIKVRRDADRKLGRSSGAYNLNDYRLPGETR